MHGKRKRNPPLVVPKKMKKQGSIIWLAGVPFMPGDEVVWFVGEQHRFGVFICALKRNEDPEPAILQDLEDIDGGIPALWHSRGTLPFPTALVREETKHFVHYRQMWRIELHRAAWLKTWGSDVVAARISLRNARMGKGVGQMEHEKDE